MPPRSSRGQKIEPLDYTEIAQASALKGSVSFLEITPGDVQSGFVRFTRMPNREELSSPGHNTVSASPSETLSPVRAIITPIRGSASVPPSLADLTRVSSPEDETAPGDETNHLDTNGNLTPGKGRSKVRRCVLAQDGHSLGEEAIYQILWRNGRPENTDPNGSRTVRMGAADIGYKVNIAKKNVRQNISRLFEKLALDILEDFDTLSSQARLYRVYSYKQILERRRSAGLEYILRNKGVVFCSKEGTAIVSSHAFVSTPGDETCLRPAPPRQRRIANFTSREKTKPSPATESGDRADIEAVSRALNRYWPVDELAAAQLLRSCRQIRKDARIEEIELFVQEKLELARGNRAITNPTGLILATVPQCFTGTTFLALREKMESKAAWEKEQAAQKVLRQTELERWLDQ